MRDLLLISYYFPPAIGIGIRRAVLFARHFHRHGFRVTVLSVRGGMTAVCEQQPEEIEAFEVIRVWSPEPAGLLRLGSRALRLVGARRGAAGNGPDAALMSWQSEAGRLFHRACERVFVPDGSAGWRGVVLRTVRRTLADRRFDLILSTCPPYTAHLIGRDLRRRSGTPWIADFRDPWEGGANREKKIWPLSVWDRRLERSVVSEADAVVACTEPMTKWLRSRHPEVPIGRFWTLPTGIDQEGIDAIPPEGRLNGKTVWAYVGSAVSGRLEATRVFLERLTALIASGRIPPDRIAVRFIGYRHAGLDRMIRRLQLETVVSCEGIKPYRQGVAAAKAADGLLYFQDPLPGMEVIAAGKFYEYAGVGKPILAVAPMDVATGWIESAGLGIRAAPDEPAAVERAIERVFYDPPPICDPRRSIGWLSSERLFGEFSSNVLGSLGLNKGEKRGQGLGLHRVLEQQAPPRAVSEVG